MKYAHQKCVKYIVKKYILNIVDVMQINDTYLKDKTTIIIQLLYKQVLTVLNTFSLGQQ